MLGKHASKKRLDSRRDDSRSKRFLKAGGTALAVGAGAVFLNQSGLSRYLGEVTEAIAPIANDLRKDLASNKKDFNALKKAYDKNIGKKGSILKKRIEENRLRNKNKRITLSDKRGTLKNIKDVILATDGVSRRTMLKTHVVDPKLKEEAFKKFRKDPRFKHLSDDKLRQLVNNVYTKVNEKTDVSKITNDTMLALISPKTFGKQGIDLDTQIDFVKEVTTLKNRRKAETILAEKKYGNLIKTQVKDEALSSEGLSRMSGNKKKNRFKKIDKIAKEKFGVDLDSELLLKGSKAVTLGDLVEVDHNGKSLLDNADLQQSLVNLIDEVSANGKKVEQNRTQEFDIRKNLDLLIDKVKKDPGLKDIVIDDTIRYDFNELGEKSFFQVSESSDLLNKVGKTLKNTLPGQILFKGIDDNEQPAIAFIESGVRSSAAALQKKTRNIADEDFDNITRGLMVNIGGITRDILEDSSGNVALSYDYEKQKVVTGYKEKMMKRLLGAGDLYRPEANDDAFSELLDFNQEGKGTFISRLKRKFGRFNDPSWGMNKIENTRKFLIDSDVSKSDLQNLDKTVMQDIYEDMDYTFNMLNNRIQGVTDNMIYTVLNHEEGKYLSDTNKTLLDQLLGNEDLDSIFKTIEANKGSIRNKNLVNLLEQYKQNPDSVEDYVKTKYIERANFMTTFLGEYAIDEDVSLNAHGQMRIEVLKNVFQDIDNTENLTNSNTINLINSLNKDLTNIEYGALKDINVLAMYEKDIRPNDVKEYSDEISSVFTDNKLGRFLERIDNNAAFKDELNADIEFMKKDIGLSSNKFDKDVNEIIGDPFAKQTFVNDRGIIGQFLIEDINNNIKINTKGAKEFFTSLNAGRNNAGAITETTLGIQYLIDRLDLGLDAIGLGLSDKSTASPLETAKNIALKRILPVMAIYEAGSVLNYESEKLTGVSLVGAAANGLKNVDMAGRRFLNATHLSSAFNWVAETSVMHEYLFGQRHFNNYEEEQDWYDNGYSPVRGGRFWTFGSSSEFRGSNINYFQPNWLKRAHSDYHDVSVYGSVDAKWAHSWIPTPQHPLAPIRRLLDPYWLEKYHLKENDRPYPLTGKMFSEGTPWGAILNPTIGQALKPVRMLPEVKHRLGKDGRDAKAIIENLNTRIKQRGNENEDLLIARGTDIRNGEYIPYGNPEPDEVNVQFSNGSGHIKGTDYMDSVQNLKDYETPNGQTYQEAEYGKAVGTTQEVDKTIDKLTRYAQEGQMSEGSVAAVRVVKSINEAIKNKVSHRKAQIAYQRNVGASTGPDKSQGVYIYRNLVNEKLRSDENYYTDMDTKSMVNKSVLSDYRKDAIYSLKQLTGIYGFLGENTFGEKAYTYRYENAGNMTSFTRGFWDSSIGGVGGEVMEIARRFFPNQDRSRVNINPLRNNMPDWIPDSYHFGDPFTQIPKGEMRLPGKGYETLNALHPDQFGDYGAFDRYKILADIAPNSAEYKTWKKIAENTVTDPDLQKQMEDIAARTAKMSGKHEFFDYKYLHNNTKYEDAVVKSINTDGSLTLGNNQRVELAGIKTNQDTQEYLKEMIQPGDKVTIRTNKDLNYDKDTNESTKRAVIYKKSENINQELLQQGGAEEDKEDNSALSILGKQSGTQEVLGAAIELVAHVPIPLIHNKFMKVESPLESYKSESIYGHSFQTWDHPIMNFIEPAFNRQSDKSIVNEALSLGYAMYHFGNVSNKIESKGLHFASSALTATLNPTAFVGGATAMFLTGMTNANVWKDRRNFKTAYQVGAEIGTTLGAVKYAWDNADNPIKSTASMALAGMTTAEKLAKLGGALEDLSPKKGAIIGAGIGLGLSALKNPGFDKDKMFKPHVSNYVKKKWELDEYFDRLNYIKYEGLYKVASARAAFFERTPVRQIFKEIDKNKKKIAKLNRKEKKLQEQQRGDLTKNQYEIEEIRQKKMALEEETNVFFKGGKYTKAAVAYKKKAESTIYGLSETATKDEILASIPDQYKDHFKAFMDISNKKEQKEILKYVPEYLQKPLKIAWGEKPDKLESNSKYFKSHDLPSMAWKGWKPNINMKHVKIKTIENEGMVMSDFGYYDSEKSKASYEMAPEIKHYDRRNRGGAIFGKANITAAMHGVGLNASNVTVEQTSRPGLWFVSDVTGTVDDTKKAAGYYAYSAVRSVMSNLF